MYRILTLILAAFVLFACNQSQTETQKIEVAVQIDFGGEKDNVNSKVTLEAGSTALEALQHAFATQTHPVGNLVFVSSIEGIETVVREKAWYYEVNGQAPKVLAINNTLHNGDKMKWIYKTDVCSEKKDRACK